MSMDISEAHSRFEQFVSFANDVDVKDKTIAGFGSDGFSIEPKSKFDFIGNIGRRFKSRNVNNRIRDAFLDSVLGMYNVKFASQLPESVQAALKLNDYDGKGRPLTARRIRAVQKAVEDNLAPRVLSLEVKLSNQGIQASEQLGDRIRTAIKGSFGDPHILNFVEENIQDIVMSNGTLRSTNEVKDIVSAIANKFDQLESFTDSTGYLQAVRNSPRNIMLQASARFLKGPIASSLYQEQFQLLLTAADEGSQQMLDVGRRITTKDPGKRTEQLNAKIQSFSRALDFATGKCKAVLDQFKGTPEEAICRNFLISLMIHKCGGLDISPIPVDEPAPHLQALLTDHPDVVRATPHAQQLKDAMDWYCA